MHSQPACTGGRCDPGSAAALRQALHGVPLATHCRAVPLPNGVDQPAVIPDERELAHSALGLVGAPAPEHPRGRGLLLPLAIPGVDESVGDRPGQVLTKGIGGVGGWSVAPS